MNLYIILAFCIYFIMIGGIGFFAYHKSKKHHDFVLGSRSLSYVVTALAAHASDMSGWLFMGFPAVVYMHGMIELWVAIGLTVFMYLNWRLVAPRIRVLSEKYNTNTMSSFFEKHFNDTSHRLKLISAIFCLVFFTFYISANFVALGHLFESIFDIHYAMGLVFGSIVVFYILLGGYLSIAWVDFFQGIFLLCMILLVPAVAFFKTTSIADILHIAAIKNISLNILPKSIYDFYAIIIAAGSWGLGYFGQPHIITKFMGINNPNHIKKALRIGISWQVITLLAATLVGLVGIAFFPNGLENNELIFVIMTKSLFSPFMSGIILCAILASAINVIAAQVLASASIITEDFYNTFFTKNKSNESALFSRYIVLGICFLALIFAFFNREKSIFGLVHFAWTGLGCTFGPLTLIALHTNIKNASAALTGCILGGVIVLVWPLFNTTIPAMFPGFFIGLISILTVDYFLKNASHFICKH